MKAPDMRIKYLLWGLAFGGGTHWPHTLNMAKANDDRKSSPSTGTNVCLAPQQFIVSQTLGLLAGFCCHLNLTEHHACNKQTTHYHTVRVGLGILSADAIENVVRPALPRSPSNPLGTEHSDYPAPNKLKDTDHAAVTWRGTIRHNTSLQQKGIEKLYTQMSLPESLPPLVPTWCAPEKNKNLR